VQAGALGLARLHRQWVGGLLLKNMILQYTITVFLTQVAFVWSRTWNVKAIADRDMSKVLISGTLIHVTWILSTLLSVVSAKEVLIDGKTEFLPVMIASLVGGLLGSYLSMRSKKF
jgi:hypothetical protein